MIKRIINWCHVTTAVLLKPAEHDDIAKYGVAVYFDSGEDIILWYDTPKQAQMFFTEMRHAFTYPCPGIMTIEA